MLEVLEMLKDLIGNVFSWNVLVQVGLLFVLEAVLSADNAIALAALTQHLHQPKLQKQLLNLGLLMAYGLRILLIVGAVWVTQFWQFELAGALYLLWLVYRHFLTDADAQMKPTQSSQHSLWRMVPVIALTDLAFSLDSITTAIALTQETWIILLGGTIGVISLRFLAEVFIRWLDRFTNLEDAGYLSIAFVGVRLLLRVIYPDWVISEWVTVSVISLLFAWGFSHRKQPETMP